MRVLIDTTYRRRAPYSGTAVYLARLVNALAGTGEVDVLTVANARRGPPAGGGLGSLRNLLADLWWSEVALPRLARRLGAEVIHHPLPAVARGSGIAQVITVHDLAFERLPACFDRGFRVYAHLAQRRAARGADAVICVSQTTASDVHDLWRVPADRIVVARHGPGQVPTGSSPGLLGEPYLLYVGDAEPRKNLRTLVAAYALYRQRSPDPASLVLVGSAEANQPGVRIEPALTAGRLAELYAGALALVQPSLYEGFGLTALEAMTMGAPVLAARSPGLTELCGDAVLYFDPRSEQKLADQLARIAQDRELRQTLSSQGRRRAEEFSWESSARAHLEAYHLAITRSSGRPPSRTPTLPDSK
jgi:glycosyltransferase involved in cell wall biosynthesis